MKRLIFKSLFVFTFISILCGCQTMMNISNGAYSDISLVRESKDYSLKRLKEVNSESSAIFGIPFDKSLDRKQGIIVRFNGINVSGSKRILPILTMIALTLPGKSAQKNQSSAELIDHPSKSIQNGLRQSHFIASGGAN